MMESQSSQTFPQSPVSLLSPQDRKDQFPAHLTEEKLYDESDMSLAGGFVPANREYGTDVILICPRGYLLAEYSTRGAYNNATYILEVNATAPVMHTQGRRRCVSGIGDQERKGFWVTVERAE